MGFSDEWSLTSFSLCEDDGFRAIIVWGMEAAIRIGDFLVLYCNILQLNLSQYFNFVSLLGALWTLLVHVDDLIFI